MLWKLAVRFFVLEPYIVTGPISRFGVSLLRAVAKIRKSQSGPRSQLFFRFSLTAPYCIISFDGI